MNPLAVVDKLGFEAEFIYPTKIGPHLDDGMEQVREMLREDQRIEPTILTMFDDPDYNEWSLAADSSINEAKGLGVELISPKLDYPEFMGRLYCVSQMIFHRGMLDESCGLHVTISVKPGIKVDPIKLVLAVDEPYLLSAFGRSENRHAVSQYDRLLTAVQENPFYHDRETQVDRLLDYGWRELSYNKDVSVWFRQDGLFQFRHMGGKQYGLFGLALSVVKLYVEAVYKATQPITAEIREAARQLLYKASFNLNPIAAAWEPRLPDREPLEVSA